MDVSNPRTHSFKYQNFIFQNMINKSNHPLYELVNIVNKHSNKS